MAGSTFKAAWWPLHVAVAWVLTRDHRFVARSNRAGKSLRSIAVALAVNKASGKPIRRRFKRASAAWSMLREEMAAGNVRTSGTPFQRLADLQGAAVETNEMAREISAVEIASCLLQDDGAHCDCLIPEDRRVARGSNRGNLRGFRNIRVLRSEVLRAFPKDVPRRCEAKESKEVGDRHAPEQPRQTDPTDQPSQVSLLEHPKEQRAGTRPSRDRALRAIRANYPEGIPDQVTLPNANLLRIIGEWLKSQNLPDVSNTTILRAAERRK